MALALLSPDVTQGGQNTPSFLPNKKRKLQGRLLTDKVRFDALIDEDMMTSPQLKQSAMWLALAGFIGFLVPAVFSMGLRWERSLFLIPYIAIVGTFLAVYFRRQPISFKQLIGPWRLGLVGVAAATALLMYNIMGHPASAVPEGAELVGTLIWVGLMYGAIDGLLLNVMPVLAVQRAWSGETPPSRKERLIRGLLALAASIFVTVAYHLGFTEFHGPALLMVIFGMIIITSVYLLTGSPLAAVAMHVIMHIAAVLHGMETTLQLPPHYALSHLSVLG